MPTISSPKNFNNVFTIESDLSINILIIGKADFFKETLAEVLRQYQINVYFNQKFPKDLNFSYIFHINNFNSLTETIYLAQKNNSTLIVISTLQIPKIELKIKKSIGEIQGSLNILFLSCPPPRSKTAAFETVDKILHSLFLNDRVKGRKRAIKENKLPKFKIRKTIKHNFFTPLNIILVIFLSGVLYGMFIFISFNLGYQNLRKATENFKNGELLKSQQLADQAYQFFSFGNKLTAPIEVIIKKVNYSEGKTIDNMQNLALKLSKTISQASYVNRLAQNIGESIISSRTSLHPSQLEELNVKVKDLVASTQVMILDMDSLKKDSSYIATLIDVNNILSGYDQLLTGANNLLLMSSQFAQILPRFLGYDKPQTLLLLYQNNTELRPTGGFIGSFGWVTFDKGKLADFQTEDVYTADGQLKGHIPPPEPLRKYLYQENWYLRDSNFDPDFTESAQKAEWFLKHEMNLTFDGVIAFDVNFIQQVLKATGGIYLNDYNEEITADNLFLKTQSQIESNFFPGSTQKKDYLGSIARNLFIKLTSSKVNWTQFVQALKSSLDQKHILVYLHDPQGQEVMENLNWAGRIASITCNKANCLPSYLMIVEANLGVNKANYLVNRQADLKISPGISGIRHELVVNYENEFPQNTFPGGAYFSYTRILLPANAKIEDVFIDKTSILNQDMQVEKYQDKISLGFPFKLNPASRSKVKILYTLPVNFVPDSTLELFVQKQPGVDNYPLEISVNKTDAVNDNIAGTKSIQKIIQLSGDHLISLPL